MAPRWSPFGRVPEVSAQGLHDRLMRAEEIQIIDVRTPHEFAYGHICVRSAFRSSTSCAGFAS